MMCLGRVPGIASLCSEAVWPHKDFPENVTAINEMPKKINHCFNLDIMQPKPCFRPLPSWCPNTLSNQNPFPLSAENFTCDSRTPAQRRRCAQHLVPIAPFAKRLQAGVLYGQRAGRLNILQLHLQLHGSRTVRRQLLPAQLQGFAQQVQLFAARWQTRLSLKSRSQNSNTAQQNPHLVLTRRCIVCVCFRFVACVRTT